MSDAELQAARGALKLAQMLIAAMAEGADIDLDETTLKFTVKGAEGELVRQVAELTGTQIVARIEAALDVLLVEEPTPDGPIGTVQ